ncbi:MAG: ABC transporter substrate-binding protein [Steroidobacteraceae bacterium]
MIRPGSRLMHRALAGAAALALALAFSGGGQAARAAAFVLRDDLQREVTFARSPQRIISLLPSLTETVCALGACERLVATDKFSDWPEPVRALPKAGGIDDAEIEAIVSLKPDLVLISDSQRITDRLHELGIASFALNTDSYAAVGRNVTVIGEILGLSDRAASLNDKINSAVQELSAQVSARRRGTAPTVYFEVDPAPYAAGPASFIGELLALLGARNIVTADLGPFPQLNPEYVVRRNPDVILVSSVQRAHFAERPGWDQIRAVKEQRLCYFAPAVRETIVRPGPRVAEGMRAIAECLERFAP